MVLAPEQGKRRSAAERVALQIGADEQALGKILEAHIKKLQLRHDALIEVLHKAQELFGFLDDGVLYFVSDMLRLPRSRVYGVATFYHFFKLKPQGLHTCVVCMGTACYVKGSSKVLETIEAHAGISAGETTPDKRLSLVTAMIGACPASRPLWSTTGS